MLKAGTVKRSWNLLRLHLQMMKPLRGTRPTIRTLPWLLFQMLLIQRRIIRRVPCTGLTLRVKSCTEPHLGLLCFCAVELLEIITTAFLWLGHMLILSVLNVSLSASFP